MVIYRQQSKRNHFFAVGEAATAVPLLKKNAFIGNSNEITISKKITINVTKSRANPGSCKAARKIPFTGITIAPR